MAGNTVYVQGSYVDVHDNEVVNLSIDKAMVKLNDNENDNDNENGTPAPHGDEEQFHFVHPELDDDEAWHVHNAVKRVVRLQGIQMICQYLMQLKNGNKVLLPPNPSAAYAELVRMGMPSGEGFSEITFRKYYNRK